MIVNRLQVIDSVKIWDDAQINRMERQSNGYKLKKSNFLRHFCAIFLAPKLCKFLAKFC